MVGKQIDVGLNERAYAPPLHTRDAGIFGFPEVPVVYQDGISLPLDRRINQCLAGGHTRHNSINPFTPLNLQTIRAVILESVWLKQRIKC